MIVHVIAKNTGRVWDLKKSFSAGNFLANITSAQGIASRFRSISLLSKKTFFTFMVYWHTAMQTAFLQEA